MSEKPAHMELPEGMTERQLLKSALEAKKIALQVASRDQAWTQTRIRQIESNIKGHEASIRKQEKDLRKLKKAPILTVKLASEIKWLEDRLALLPEESKKQSKTKKTDPDQNY